MERFGRDTALIVVDVQNDFARPDGSLYVPGADTVLPAVNVRVIRAVAAGSPVFYTQDWHPESTPHFQKDGGIWPAHCVADTPGADLHARLVVAGPSIHKGSGGEDGYSGFTVRDPQSGATTPTQLADLLEEAGVQWLVVVGLALDYCVKDTALDGARLGYRTLLPRAATAAVDLEPGDGDRALSALEEAGVGIV